MSSLLEAESEVKDECISKTDEDTPTAAPNGNQIKFEDDMSHLSTAVNLDTKEHNENLSEVENSGPPAESKEMEKSVTNDVGRKQDNAADARVANFVIEALRNVSATEASVHSCAGGIQSNFADDPALIDLALHYIVSFFLCVDNKTKLTTFYVINELIQYDSRFRIPVLRKVIPHISWSISSLPERDGFMKTVSVWQQRSIYPPETCKTIEALFQAAPAAQKNAVEFEQRLGSLPDMIRIRSAKDEDLESTFLDGTLFSCDDADLVTQTAATIMAASTTELRNYTISSRAVLSATQGCISYLTRLLVDFEEQYSSANQFAMADSLETLSRSAAFAEMKDI